MTGIDENTSGRRDAKRAVDDATTSSIRTDKLIAETRQSLDAIRARRETNHFQITFQHILRGGH